LVLTASVDVALVNGLQADGPRLRSECLAVERLFAIGPPMLFADCSALGKNTCVGERIEPLSPDKLRDTVTSSTSGAGIT
jgi:hypothetical protein